MNFLCVVAISVEGIVFFPPLQDITTPTVCVCACVRASVCMSLSVTRCSNNPVHI
jgi:hypothetical protein